MKEPRSKFIGEFEKLYKRYYGMPIKLVWDGKYFRTTGIDYGVDIRRLRIMCAQLRTRLGMSPKDPLEQVS